MDIILADIIPRRFAINQAPEPREKEGATERRRRLPDVAPLFKGRAAGNRIDVCGAAA